MFEITSSTFLLSPKLHPHKLLSTLLSAFWARVVPLDAIWRKMFRPSMLVRKGEASFQWPIVLWYIHLALPPPVNPIRIYKLHSVLISFIGFNTDSASKKSRKMDFGGSSLKTLGILLLATSLQFAKRWYFHMQHGKMLSNAVILLLGKSGKKWLLFVLVYPPNRIQIQDVYKLQF